MSGLQKQVADFLGERNGFVRAIQNCPASNMEDYWRWQGHAEARRVLRESLERDGIDLTAAVRDEAAVKAEALPSLTDLTDMLRETFTAEPGGVTWEQAAESLLVLMAGEPS